MLSEDFSESGSLPVFSKKGGRILIRSLVFSRSLRVLDFFLVSLILTDSIARNFSFTFIIYLSIISQNTIDFLKQDDQLDCSIWTIKIFWLSWLIVGYTTLHSNMLFLVPSLAIESFQTSLKIHTISDPLHSLTIEYSLTSHARDIPNSKSLG